MLSLLRYEVEEVTPDIEARLSVVSGAMIAPTALIVAVAILPGLSAVSLLPRIRT
jgi:hypothetical protein